MTSCVNDKGWLVYTCRDEPGLDTHTHAPALRLQHKRGAVVLSGVHRRWHPLGTSPTHRRDAKSRTIAELQRLADDNEEARGMLPLLAHVQKRAECVVAQRIRVPARVEWAPPAHYWRTGS